MEGSNESSNSPAPFLVKTYEMVDDPFTNSVVSWSQTGQSFVVWNPPEFAGDLLSKYFKHNNFSSFIRQLNTYGFRKIDPQQWEFSNEEFIRGQKHLLKNIHRRKAIHSHSGQGNAAPLTDSERASFEMEIEKLRREKISLQSELQRHKHENQEYEYQVRSLGQTLQNIDQRQQQLMFTLSTIEQQSESHNKKRRSLGSHFLHVEGNLGENQTSTFLVNSSISSLPLLNMGQVEKLDSSFNFWEKFLEGIDQTPSQHSRDLRLHPMPSPVITEIARSSGDSDLNVHMSASPSRDHHSSAELAASSTYVSSPAISSICIDVNLSPAKICDTEIEMPNDRKCDITFSSMTTRVNDVFWQQFLTEAPGSSVMQEALSESTD